MEMSNVNKFAIHNCNHLMPEQTGERLGHKAMSGWTNTNTKASRRVAHAKHHPSSLPAQAPFSLPALFSRCMSLSLFPSLERDVLHTLLSKGFCKSPSPP